MSNVYYPSDRKLDCQGSGKIQNPLSGLSQLIWAICAFLIFLSQSESGGRVMINVWSSCFQSHDKMLDHNKRIQEESTCTLSLFIHNINNQFNLSGSIENKLIAVQRSLKTTDKTD